MEASKTTANYNPFYRDAYEFHKRWMPCPHDDDEWMQAAAELGKVSCKYNNHPFMMDLLNAVYSDLERAYKEYIRGE